MGLLLIQKERGFGTPEKDPWISPLQLHLREVSMQGGQGRPDLPRLNLGNGVEGSELILLALVVPGVEGPLPVHDKFVSVSTGL